MCLVSCCSVLLRSCDRETPQSSAVVSKAALLHGSNGSSRVLGLKSVLDMPHVVDAIFGGLSAAYGGRRMHDRSCCGGCESWFSKGGAIESGADPQWDRVVMLMLLALDH